MKNQANCQITCKDNFIGRVGAPATPASLPEIDLRHVRARVRKESGLSAAAVRKASHDYLEYWQFIKNSGTAGHDVPSHEVDLIWHAHILFTRQYMEDTEKYFGHYLHHEPNTRGN